MKKACQATILFAAGQMAYALVQPGAMFGLHFIAKTCGKAFQIVMLRARATTGHFSVATLFWTHHTSLYIATVGQICRGTPYITVPTGNASLLVVSSTICSSLCLTIAAFSSPNHRTRGCAISDAIALWPRSMQIRFEVGRLTTLANKTAAF